MKAIRAFCVVVALAGVFETASAQGQAASGTEQSREGTAPLADDVSLLAQDPQQSSKTPDGKSSLPDAPGVTPAANNPNEQFGKQPKFDRVEAGCCNEWEVICLPCSSVAQW